MGIFGRLMVMDANLTYDKIMKEKLEAMDAAPLASNENSELHGELLDVNGFQFIGLKLVGPMKIESFQGCDLTFSGSFGEFEMESDSMEIKTGYSRGLKIGITEFDIDLDEELIDLINNKTIDSITIKVKKDCYTLDAVNQEQLRALIS